MRPLDSQIMTQDGSIEIRKPTGPSVKLAFFGDLAFHGAVLESLVQESPDAVFDGFRNHTLQADLVIGNLESVLVRHPYSPLGGKACLISDLRALAGLEAAGFHVLTLANNHIMDAGPDGLRECLEGIAASPIAVTGAGLDAEQARRPASRRVGPMTFKIFSYSYGAGQITGRSRAGCNEAVLGGIRKDVAEFCEEGDFAVVCLHMDAEFQPTPAPDRVAMCRKLAEDGVPLVICHHPHVLQGIEIHQGSLIAYSLGNYIFSIQPYMRQNSDETHLTCHLEIEVDVGGPVSARIEPAEIDNRGAPSPAEGKTRRDILSMVAERSRLLSDPSALNERYLRMAKEFTSATFKNIYWAIGERDLGRLKLLTRSLIISRTKRNWIRHYLLHRLFGR